ncbi:hypothetical protein [Micromonospora inyonensis]|nr:hypothetical protein [Micromonospora inyonensis]
MHPVDVLDGHPEPGGEVVQIHADDPTGRSRPYLATSASSLSAAGPA